MTHETCPTCKGSGQVRKLDTAVRVTCSSCGLEYQRGNAPRRDMTEFYCPRPECQRAYMRKRKRESVDRLALGIRLRDRRKA